MSTASSIARVLVPAALLALGTATSSLAGDPAGESPGKAAKAAGFGKAGRAGKAGKAGKGGKGGKGGKRGKAGREGKGAKASRIGAGSVPIYAWRTGQYRRAVQAIRQALETAPDDPELLTMMGISLARAGWAADALPYFELGMGSMVYETDGIGAHADALRDLGRGLEAVALRRELIAMAEDPNDEIRPRLNVVDDLRYSGDPWTALDAAEDALAFFPGSSMGYAVLADVYIDLGDLDEAQFLLWVHGRNLGDDQATSRERRARARIAMIDGDLQQIDVLTDDLRGRVPRDLSAVAMRAEALRQMGQPTDALALLDTQRWSWNEDPEVLAVRAMVLADLHEPVTDVCRRITALYLERPDVRNMALQAGCSEVE